MKNLREPLEEINTRQTLWQIVGSVGSEHRGLRLSMEDPATWSNELKQTVMRRILNVIAKVLTPSYPQYSQNIIDNMDSIIESATYDRKQGSYWFWSCGTNYILICFCSFFEFLFLFLFLLLFFIGIFTEQEERVFPSAILQGKATRGYFGKSVCSGDFDADGNIDVVFGVPGWGVKGKPQVLLVCLLF